jgi:2-oxoglutarate ferredoxin oxidoreductase subunit gamma
MAKTEVTFSGYGGQGVVISSIIYATALTLEGFKVLQTQSFGIEARGGASKGELIYSTEEVNYLEVNRPDLLVMMSKESFEKYSDTVEVNGIAVIDSFYTPISLIESYRDSNPALSVYSQPFTEISIQKFESALFSNVIVLGYLSNLSKDIEFSNMQSSVKKCIKPEFIEKNMEALDLGYDLAQRDITYNV